MVPSQNGIFCAINSGMVFQLSSKCQFLSISSSQNQKNSTLMAMSLIPNSIKSCSLEAILVYSCVFNKNLCFFLFLVQMGRGGGGSLSIRLSIRQLLLRQTDVNTNVL